MQVRKLQELAAWILIGIGSGVDVYEVSISRN